MGKLDKLVNFSAGMEGFRVKYRIPPDVSLDYCSLEEVLIKRRTGQVAILVIAFVEGGMIIPMGRITRDYLRVIGWPLTNASRICSGFWVA